MQKDIEIVVKLDFEQTFSCLKDLYVGQYGLYNGRVGLCMGAFLMHRNTGEATWNEEAMRLLDEICENIGMVKQLNFSSGLSGIGWALEWIVQHNFVEANTDDVLESLDDELFKAIIYTKFESLSLETGTIGLALFFYKRLTAQNPYPSRYRNVYLIESLVLLTDHLYNGLLYNEDALLSNPKEEDLKIVAQALVLVCLIEPLRINHEKVKAIIRTIFRFIQTVPVAVASGTSCAYELLWQARATATRMLNGSRYTASEGTIISPFLLKNTSPPPERGGVYDLLNKTIYDEYDNWKEAWLHF